MQGWARCADCVCNFVTKNPVTLRLLGLCPLLAVSNTIVKAATLSILLVTVVILSASVTSLLRYCVSWRLKPVHHALIASFTTATVIAMAGIRHYELVAALGIYPALIASNCLVLSFMQEFAERNALAPTVSKVLRDAVYIVVFFGLFGALREFGAYGSLFTDLQLIHGGYSLGPATSAGPIPVMASAPGALLTLALILAAANAITRSYQQPGFEPSSLLVADRSATSRKSS